METIKDLPKDELTLLVKTALPNVKVEDSHIWAGEISSSRLYRILKTVRVGKCIEDALKLLGDFSSLRKSVAYDIPVSYDARSEVKFEVVDTQRQGPSPQGYLGHVFTYDNQGNEVRQITLENLSLN
jgi:hypothetical protein